MVQLSLVKAVNAAASSSLASPSSAQRLVAVFAGATAGIGELSLKAFAKYAPRPKIYFLGRSDEAGERLSHELKALNADGEYVFVKAELSLLKEVDRVSAMIMKAEEAVNLLFMSQGTLRISGDTPEGLNYLMALSYYGRTRMALNLLPHLCRAQSLRRVVTVWTGTKEGKMYDDDVPGKSVPLRHARSHSSALTTLSLQALQREAPDVSFVHVFPGSVKTELIRKDDGMLMQVLRWYFNLSIRKHNWLDNDEVGERHAFTCLAGRYPAHELSEGMTTQGPLVDGVDVAKGVDGEPGSGVYSVDDACEAASDEIVKLLMDYKDAGSLDKIWKHTEGEFERITGKRSI